MPLNEAEAVTLVERLSRELQNRQRYIDRWDRYYRGVQPLTYASDQWRQFHADRYKDHSDNWCGVVADSPAERNVVSGIRLPTDGSGTLSPETDDELWRVWQINEGDADSSAGFVDANVSSRVFVLVWGDNPVEVTWESPQEMIVAYEPGSRRKRTAALKMWREDDYTEYATLYLPDEVWKFNRKTSVLDVPVTGVDLFKWRPRELELEPNPQPNPMGVVPVVELQNRPRLDGTCRSEIDGVAATQDAINLLWAYLFTTADFASFPQRVVMGQSPPKVPVLNSDGDIVGEKTVPLDKFMQDRIVWLTGQNASIGEWKAASLGQFTDIVEVQVGHLAAQTRTPQHYLVGKMANLSAEALVAAESGLVQKVREQQLFYGPRIREVFRLIALAQDDRAKAAAVAAGQVVWKDAESRSEQQMADKIIKLRQAGFPFKWLIEEYGVSPTEVGRIMEMKRVELEEASRADIAAMMGDPTGVPDDE